MHQRSNLRRLGAALAAALVWAIAGQAFAFQARFDFNGDGLVDAADAQLFAACMSGAGVPHDGSLNCLAADIDGDGDVDQSDFGIFQRCSNGIHPADPNCTNFHAPLCTLWNQPETLEDTPCVIQLAATDADLPWDQLTFRIVIAPTRGGRFYQVAADGTPRTDLPPIQSGNEVTNPDAKVWFVPPPNFHSSPLLPDVAFRYAVRDAAGAQSDPLDVPIHIESVNDPPALAADNFTFSNDRPVSHFVIQPTDVEVAAGEQTFSICFTALPQHGTLYADGVTPITQVPACFPTLSYTYAWNDYRPFDCGPDWPASAYPISDSFSCYANDGFANSDTVTDTITINYFNSPPVLTGPASVETVEEVSVPVEIMAADVDNDTILVGIMDPLPTRGILYYFDPDAFLTLPVAPGQEFTGVPVELTYVPLPNADTAYGLPDLIHVRLRDVRNGNPLDARDCDDQIPIHIAPINDPPVVTCTNPVIIADVLQDGTIQPAFTNGLRVADDALPDDLLSVTLTAAGPEADHLVLVDNTGLVAFQQISPTQISFQGTLTTINAAFAQGVYWYPNASQTYTGTLAVEVNDQGHTGNENPPVPLTGTLILPVEVDYEGSIPIGG